MDSSERLFLLTIIWKKRFKTFFLYYKAEPRINFSHNWKHIQQTNIVMHDENNLLMETHLNMDFRKRKELYQIFPAAMSMKFEKQILATLS